MPGVPSFISQSGFWALTAFLVIVVFLRSQSTYWLARLVTSGFLSTAKYSQRPWVRRLQGKLQSASTKRGVDAVDRWGLVIIPLSFLTIGLQTVIHLGAGVLRMRWFSYTLCAIPGYIAWGLLYAAVFTGLFSAGQAAASGKYWVLIPFTFLVAALSIYWMVKRRRA